MNPNFELDELAERRNRAVLLKSLDAIAAEFSPSSVEVILTSFPNARMQTRTMEFKFVLPMDPIGLTTHITHHEYLKTEEHFLRITEKMAEPFLHVHPFSFINYISLDASPTEPSKVLRNVDGTTIEQGTFFEEDGDTYLILYWDDSRIYFYLNPADGVKEHMKSKEATDFKSLTLD